MAKLIIIYDPKDVLGFEVAHLPEDIRPDVASLSVAEDIQNRDIYEIARRLAELLLEQL
jgi:hypothetical protein